MQESVGGRRVSRWGRIAFLLLNLFSFHQNKQVSSEEENVLKAPEGKSQRKVSRLRGIGGTREVDFEDLSQISQRKRPYWIEASLFDVMSLFQYCALFLVVIFAGLCAIFSSVLCRDPRSSNYFAKAERERLYRVLPY